jgi:voltage-gated potassium channel
MFKKIRNRLFTIIGPTKKGDKVSSFYDIFICSIVFLSSVAVIFELIDISEQVNNILRIFEYVAVGIFILEYLIKLSLAKYFFPNSKNTWEAIKEYLISFDSFIDILSIVSVLFNEIPKELTMLRLLKLVKLVRLAKMGDYIENVVPKDSKLERAQKRVYEVIMKDKEGDKLSKIYDIAIIVLIVISVALLTVETFEIPSVWHEVISTFEIVIACIFAVEYVLRVWIAPLDYPDMTHDKARMHYIFSFMSLIDLLSIVPVFIVGLPNTTGVFKLFKLVKIVRLVKISRYINGIAAFGEAVKAKRKQIFFSTVAMIILIIICSLLMYSVEHDAQPDVFTNGFSGFVYGFSSITSFGETDVGPVTTMGKILSTVMLLLGGCIFGIPVAIIGDAFGTMVSKQSGEEEKEEVDILEMAKQYKELDDEAKENFNKLIR